MSQRLSPTSGLAPERDTLTAEDYRELGLTSDERGEALSESVERIDWDQHYEYLNANWEAGQHYSIFAPTDGGKSHLIRVGLLPLWQRYPVLWMMYKPRDSTIRGLGNRVRSFPTWDQRAKYQMRPPDSEKWEKDPEWFVLVLPAFRWTQDGKRGSESWQRAQRVAGEAMDRAFREGGWVVVVDEVRAFSDSDSPSLGLSAVLENLWQRGRSQPVTVIAATQAPARAPYSMYDQARYVALGRTLDVGRYQRISEIGGDTERIKAVLPTLEHREFLFVDRREGLMQIVTAPPA